MTYFTLFKLKLHSYLYKKLNVYKSLVFRLCVFSDLNTDIHFLVIENINKVIIYKFYLFLPRVKALHQYLTLAKNFIYKY